MARIVSAILAGAVVYYVWGMLAWMVLPLHNASVNELPDQQSMIDDIRALNLESGVYVAPYAADSASMTDPNSAYLKNHRAGPIFSLYLRKEGAEPMGMSVLLSGFVLDLLASGLAVLLLLGMGSCSQNYWCRVGFVAGLGVFVAIVGHLTYWNWMYFPWDYTLAFIIDVVIGWALAGLAIAALIRPGLVVKQEKTPALAPASTAESVRPKPQAPASAPVVAKQPTRNDAITLLAALQREARFVDIVREPLGDYTDAQIGAAARDVLRDCGSVLDRFFQLKPVVDQEDGAEVPLPTGASASKVHITGTPNQDASTGVLVHHGWEASQCELPTWTGTKSDAMVIAPAEIEVK